jgi:hypothetical protein
MNKCVNKQKGILRMSKKNADASVRKVVIAKCNISMTWN